MELEETLPVPGPRSVADVSEVATLRADGVSWTVIGVALGNSREGAGQRHAVTR